MKFFFGVAVGAAGMWAYQSGKLGSLMGIAPEPVQQAWQPAADRLNQVVNSEPVRRVASTMQDKVEQARTPEIVTPTPAEISGRPSEPLPTSGM
jgi:hypothetical protein